MRSPKTTVTFSLLFLLFISNSLNPSRGIRTHPHFETTTSRPGNHTHGVELLLNTPCDSQLVKECLGQNWESKDEFPYFRKSVKTGRAPKSCCFSPDGTMLAVCLLSDNGVDLYDTRTMHMIKRITPAFHEGGDPYTNREHFWGYAEGQFHDQSGDFWFTRMTTGEFYVYQSEVDTIFTYDAKGSWTKAVSFSPTRTYVAFSHWLSNSITIFDTQSRSLLKKIKTGKTPRGMAWIDERTIAVALYGTGDVQVFHVETGELMHTITPHGHSARDVCYDPRTQMIYFSDSGRSVVRKYNWTEKKMAAVARVDMKPNSIRLTPDGQYLFVSCRGPNNPQGYTLRSPRNGSIYLLRTDDMTVAKKWTGGNQPTGLAISPDGRMLATTDFQDHRLNLYIIAQ